MRIIEATIIDAALTQSIWAALSIALIFYILKKQEVRDKNQAEREAKYHEIIENLSEKLSLLESLSRSVEEIKSVLLK